MNPQADVIFFQEDKLCDEKPTNIGKSSQKLKYGYLKWMNGTPQNCNKVKQLKGVLVSCWTLNGHNVW